MNSFVRPLRVLVADDESSLLDSYRRVLGDLTGGSDAVATDLDALSAELFGEPDLAVPAQSARLTDVIYCQQGEEAVAIFQEGKDRGQPIGVVFLDMRMPPGIDGLETAKRLRAIDPVVNIVIVTGYSDHKPEDIAHAVGGVDRLFYLVKPFDADELRQLTMALAQRWSSDMTITDELASKVRELEQANRALAASEAQAQVAARRDSLTGLTNRYGIAEGFETGPQSGGGTCLTVLYLDLDHFKNVNDTLGHAAGDAVIREFASRIKNACMEDALPARLGGDEFVVICTSSDRVEALTERLLSVSRQPFEIHGRSLPMSLSIGVAQSDSERADLMETIRRADIALYAAKAAGRGVARLFDPSMEREILETQELGAQLALAIGNNELALHYQPLMSQDGIGITGVEALLRWHHPVLGPIPPSLFVKVAEKTELIHRLGDWVIDRAFADAVEWPAIVTSINLSAAQLFPTDFVRRIQTLCASRSLEPRMIEFEITETFLVADIAVASARVKELKDAGFRVALDDFGSGYASLAYLNQIPFDKLKIDQSFIRDLDTKTNAGGIIRSIVGLAHAMGLTTTAEGVEHSSQHAFLKEAGCNQMQGYLFHRPGPKEIVRELLVASGKSARSVPAA